MHKNITLIDHLFLYAHPIIILGIIKCKLFPNSQKIINRNINSKVNKKILSVKGVKFYNYFKKPNIDMKEILYEVFIQEIYRDLKVKNRYILDIGAAYGDTALYFASKGASMVYSYEPNKIRFIQAQKNIKLNSKKLITVLNEEADSKTIDMFVNKFKEKRKVLKIDCEGGEYEQILKSKFIKEFDQIIVEYHYGYLNLVSFLKNVGFKVKYTRPKISGLNGEMAIGMIYAQKSI